MSRRFQNIKKSQNFQNIQQFLRIFFNKPQDFVKMYGNFIQMQYFTNELLSNLKVLCFPDVSKPSWHSKHWKLDLEVTEVLGSNPCPKVSIKHRKIKNKFRQFHPVGHDQFHMRCLKSIVRMFWHLFPSLAPMILEMILSKIKEKSKQQVKIQEQEGPAYSKLSSKVMKSHWQKLHPFWRTIP